MQNNFYYTTNPSVYPGEYVPLFKENDLKKHKKYCRKNKIKRHPVSIRELENSYIINLEMPGEKKENLLLKACANVISIFVIHNNDELNIQNIQQHELHFAYYYTRNLILPDNADSVFVIAEYKDGVLQLYVPKSTHPLKWINTKIAIY